MLEGVHLPAVWIGAIKRRRGVDVVQCTMRSVHRSNPHWRRAANHPPACFPIALGFPGVLLWPVWQQPCRAGQPVPGPVLVHV
jgi:hypothetical protein